MPEDFSKDMPAADMVENLDITELKKFDNPEYGNLIRRWWDIKETGWFGKQLGSVMMDISVQRISQNKAKLFHANSYNVTDRMDFMLMLDDVFHQRHDKLNENIEPGTYHINAYHSAFLSMAGRKIIVGYRDHVANNQKWVIHSNSAPENGLTVSYATLLSSNVYLEASFTYAPNKNVLPREFREIAMAKMNFVIESFNINYQQNNPIKKVVENDWVKLNNQEIVEQHRSDVQKVLYGPDPEKALLQQEKEMKEFKIKDEAELREALKHDPL
ncbi:MAG: hypothetical protein EOO07_05275 [Chitinophagaceae bacterium]|nr:MAG: hypothetical protein EOO07_05275 [Chitinophagaceae bacterium]